MITKEQALTLDYFHIGECTSITGPRGGVKESIKVCRRNGATKTWKTRSEEFRVPVKFGLTECGYITQSDGNRFHAPEDCPVRDTEFTI